MQSNTSKKASDSILNKMKAKGTQHYIFKVRKELRDVNSGAYEPEIIAIGPYHHGKGNLMMMEEHKLRYLHLLLEERGEENVEKYTSAIAQLEEIVRNCYTETISLDGAELVEMLVLDGCFIIELLRQFSRREIEVHERQIAMQIKVDVEENDPIFQREWMMKSLHRDLLLLENQIPFLVLRELFDLIEGPDRAEILIKRVLCFSKNVTSLLVPNQTLHREEIRHLLDLVYPSAFTVGRSPPRGMLSNSLGRERLLIPSATKLKDANVEFCAKKSHSLFEVKFENGIMEIPPFIMDDKAECYLRNLVAYEQYFLKGQHNLISDYVIFLNCLIDTPRDVEILSECKIVTNLLCDNEAVANTINRLGISVGHGEYFSYARMFDRVNRHYGKRWNKWMAMLRRDIFYSPWAYLSFFAALVILVLTIVQAVCSILQVV